MTVEDAVGATIRDSQGRNYIDFVAGYGIFNFGHNPPAIVAALQRELSARPLWNRPFLNAPLAKLAERLAGLAPGDLEKVFVCSTGAEAVDSAIKLARLATRRPEIVAASGAFHGYTLGALSLAGIPSQRKPFEPLLPHVRHVRYGNLQELECAVTKETAAVVLEPIQAEIGAESPPPGYLAGAGEICDAAGALLVIDEVRTGMGRTGRLFAIEHEGIIPDILVLGKSLGGGLVPIGAIVARGSLWSRFGLSFAMSASSFAGNRLACVAALAALDLAVGDGLLERARDTADVIASKLEALPRQFPSLIERVSGSGLLLGVHLASPKQASEVIRHAIGNGLLVAAAFCNSRCLLLEPPLTLAMDQADRGLEVLAMACDRATVDR